MNKALIIVDPQSDFIDGSLPVPGAATAMDSLAEYIRNNDGEYVLKVITADWHPYAHSSFADNGGQWPRHCVQHQQGASIWASVIDAVYSTKGYATVLTKGTEVDKEEYSVFQNQESGAKLKRLIEDYNVDKIDICGIAGDVCVLNTLKDGVGIFGAPMFDVLKEFSPSLDGGIALNEYVDSLSK